MAAIAYSTAHQAAPAQEPAVKAQFQALDPGIVNEAIPAFFVGRNQEGFWVARDAKGRIGGIFLLENSALLFAKRNSRLTGCATILPSERFELDLDNRGNPLVAPLVWGTRLVMRGWQRMAAFIGDHEGDHAPAGNSSNQMHARDGKRRFPRAHDRSGVRTFPT
jgi:hypothetical protein